jgi:D-glycero-alpha-D-manno-heptose 1-phosphate guanylyltransferase
MLDTAIILAGGQGTRLRPAVQHIPKVMIEVRGQPLLSYVIRDFERQGIKRIVISIGYKADKIVEHFDKQKHGFPSELIYSIEDKPLGTGGAIKLAARQLRSQSDILVANGDTIYQFDINEMYRIHKESNAFVTVGLTTVDDIRAFGAVEVHGNIIKRFTEKPKLSVPTPGIINAGLYIISERALHKLPAEEAFSFERDFLEKVISTEKVCWHKIQGFYTVNNIEQYFDMLKKLPQQKQ